VIDDLLGSLGDTVAEAFVRDGVPQAVTSAMCGWYQENGTALACAVAGVVSPWGRTNQEFTSVARSLRRLKLTLHLWGSDSSAAPVQHPHNHLMSAASLIVSGELRQLTYPLLTPSVAVAAWASRMLLDCGAPDGVTYCAGEAYSLTADTFHSVETRRAGTATVFVMLPPVYSGNIHVHAQSGAVSLKVKPAAARTLEGLRHRVDTAAVYRVLRDLAFLDTDGAAVTI